MNADTLRAEFRSHFSREPQVIARAPGRVNLIGEHVDYNEGLVLPIATAESTWVACAASGSGDPPFARVRSREFGGPFDWPVEQWRRTAQPRWTGYVAGVAALLAARGARVGSFEMLVASDVPVGGGVSSSAAIEVAVGLALAHLAGEPLDSTEMVDLCAQAEREFAGVPCGIMDQSASLLCREGHALLLDCRSREVEHIPATFDGHALLLIDSGVQHELASGEYAARRAECGAALDYFRRVNPATRSLRDVSSRAARSHALQMDPLAAARAAHVTAEIERTAAAAGALRCGDLRLFGELMSASHASLRDQYQVSCDELDAIVRHALAISGVLGARLTGAGFGGCAIALAKAAAVEPLTRALTAQRGSDPPLAAACRVLRTGPGASIVLG